MEVSLYPKLPKVCEFVASVLGLGGTLWYSSAPDLKPIQYVEW
jgi:hypothetical protein